MRLCVPTSELHIQKFLTVPPKTSRGWFGYYSVGPGFSRKPECARERLLLGLGQNILVDTHCVTIVTNYGPEKIDISLLLSPLSGKKWGCSCRVLY